MTESEQMAHAFGMRAFLNRKPRSANPYNYGHPDAHQAAMYKAWDDGWCEAKVGEESTK